MCGDGVAGLQNPLFPFGCQFQRERSRSKGKGQRAKGKGFGGRTHTHTHTAPKTGHTTPDLWLEAARSQEEGGSTGSAPFRIP